MSLKEKLFSNLEWKIVAILLALVLWFHVATERFYEKRFPARVEMVGLARNLEVETVNPRSTDVSVLGTGKQLLQLMFSGGLRAHIDLTLVSRPGVYEYDLSVSDFYNIDVSSFRSIAILGGNHFKVAIRSRS